METYYETVDANEKKRVRESSKNKWNEIINKHKQYTVASLKLAEERRARE